MPDRARSRLIALLITLSCIAQACDNDASTPADSAAPAGDSANISAAQAFATRRECPLDSVVIVLPADSHNVAQVITEVPLAGDITNVPEFHDCQRFVVRRGDQDVYDSLYAIFASERDARIYSATPRPTTGTVRPGSSPADLARDSLSNLTGAPAVRADTGTATATATGVLAVAQIYSWGGTYEPLGIKPLFNCLIIWKGAPPLIWRAKMVHVGHNENGCNGTISPDVNGTELNVQVRTASGFSNPADYPPVARWQRTANGVYTIGIRCEAAWCHVGQFNFQPEEPLPIPVGTPKGKRRVRMIHGWYDRQALALPVADAPANAPPLRPSRITGIAIPDSLLEARTAAEFDAGWVPVSTIELRSTTAEDSVYRRKLNLDRGENQVFLRKQPGTMNFRALIRSRSGREVEFDVRRHDHTGLLENHGIRIVGTNRWRWQKDDETLWTRCLEGCCEVIRK